MNGGSGTALYAGPVNKHIRCAVNISVDGDDAVHIADDGAPVLDCDIGGADKQKAIASQCVWRACICKPFHACRVQYKRCALAGARGCNAGTQSKPDKFASLDSHHRS
ncbi:hypothetical protein [Stenotrophomonas sp.]|uniref:hypothetical protein n=1 Tax=Stenotrophomonas sp. TaxID=69392 RepID=UPI0031D64798